MDSSAENSSMVTPFLKPRAFAFDIPTSPLNVIAPVPWSTLKNLPTRKNPYWSVLTQKTLPLRFSHT